MLEYACIRRTVIDGACKSVPAAPRRVNGLSDTVRCHCAWSPGTVIKGRAPTDFSFGPNAAAVAFDDLVHDRKADTGALKFTRAMPGRAAIPGFRPVLGNFSLEVAHGCVETQEPNSSLIW
jgi:hypothetical protein